MAKHALPINTRMATLHFTRDFDYSPADIYGFTYAFYAGDLHDDLDEAVAEAAVAAGAAIVVPAQDEPTKPSKPSKAAPEPVVDDALTIGEDTDGDLH